MSLQETIASETDCRQTGVLISVGGVCISDGSVFRFRMEVFPFRIGVFSNLDWCVLVSEGGVTILDDVFCFWMGVFRFWMFFYILNGGVLISIIIIIIIVYLSPHYI